MLDMHETVGGQQRRLFAAVGLLAGRGANRRQSSFQSGGGGIGVDSDLEAHVAALRAGVVSDRPDDLRAWAKEVAIRHCHNVAAVALLARTRSSDGG